MPAIEMAAETEQEDSVLLKNLVPLNALSDEDLGRLISRISIEKLVPGEFLFREGDTDNKNVYLVEGKVALMSRGREVDSVVSGSNTARFALAHQCPRKFSARAVGRVQCVRIESRILSDLLVRAQSQTYRVSELETDGDDDWMSQVLRARLFQQIPASNIQNLLRRMEQLVTAKGDVVIRQGDEGDFYYVIIQGRCSVSRLEQGQVNEVARIGPGDGFGEEALLSGRPRGSTVTMITDGILVRLKREDFSELIQRPLDRRLNLASAEQHVKEGARWLDLRTAGQFAKGHMPDAVNLPLEQLRERCPELEPEQEYLAYGEEIGQAAVGVFLLLERGFEVFTVEGVKAASLAADQGGDDATQPAENDQGSSTETGAAASGAQEQRIAELEESLRQTQERFQKALYQRIGELRQARQALDETKRENATLREANEALKRQREEQQQRQEELTRERDSLRDKAEELERELEDVQDVLQEASAEESAHQWERVRQEEKLKRLEQELEEQREINRVLRQEGEEHLRRMESLRSELEAGKGS